MNLNQKLLSLEERKARVVARGELTDHAHVVVGDCTIERKGKETIINVEDGGAVMRHLLESKWVEMGEEVWTEEHTDIELEPNTSYKYVQQHEYNPFDKIVERIKD